MYLTEEEIRKLKGKLNESYDATLDILKSMTTDSDYTPEFVEEFHDILKQLNEIKTRLRKW